jgi:oxygen-dependent protoporphyrinogen oxidase
MQPELLNQSDEEIRGLVNQELRAILGMSQMPEFSDVVRYENAMPQYHVGHLQRVASIEKCLAVIPGLLFAGSAYYGVGIPDSISSGRMAAESVVRGLQAG